MINLKSTLRDRIKSRQAKILVWGMGYIGLTSARKFASKGICVTGYDPSAEVVRSLRSNAVHLQGLDGWLNMDIQQVLRKGLIEIENDLGDPGSVDVHLICVPTEKDNTPDRSIIDSILSTITRSATKETLVVIESTICPSWTDSLRELTIENPLLRLASAPRRDWFTAEGHFDIVRVVGAMRPDDNELVWDLYRPVETDLRLASSFKSASMVKVVENSLRFLNIAFANELSRIFTDVSMVEIFDLCATKWNIPHYTPSAGIGGYCIPIAPNYLQGTDGRSAPEEVGILVEAQKQNDSHTGYVIDQIHARYEGPFAILGLSYMKNSAVTRNSPAIDVAEGLTKRGNEVVVHDPRLADAEIQKLTNAPIRTYAESIRHAKTILIMSGHDEYKSLFTDLLAQGLTPVVVDNLGHFRSLAGAYPAYSVLLDWRTP